MFYGKWKMTDDITIYHKTIYDYDSFKKVLVDNGFTNVKRWNWREVEHVILTTIHKHIYPIWIKIMER